MFLCAPRTLLMDQVQVAVSCLFVCIQFEQCSRSSELVGGGNSIIARIKNVSRPILRELVFAQLE